MTTPPLSPRESEVLGLIARGHDHKQVAAVLGISTETVKTFMKMTRLKLSARTTEHAVAIAIRAGALQ